MDKSIKKNLFSSNFEYVTRKKQVKKWNFVV